MLPPRLRHARRHPALPGSMSPMQMWLGSPPPPRPLLPLTRRRRRPHSPPTQRVAWGTDLHHSGRSPSPGPRLCLPGGSGEQQQQAMVLANASDLSNFGYFQRAASRELSCPHHRPRHPHRPPPVNPAQKHVTPHAFLLLVFTCSIWCVSMLTALWITNVFFCLLLPCADLLWRVSRRYRSMMDVWAANDD